MTAVTPAGLFLMLVSAAIQFLIIYSAVRLALKHERGSSNRGT